MAGQAPREDLGIYHHFTVAIDTDNIKKVFDAVKDMVNGSQIFFLSYRTLRLTPTLSGFEILKIRTLITQNCFRENNLTFK